MKGLIKYLLFLAIVAVGNVGCQKADADKNENKQGQYGHWEWVGQNYLHSPAVNGVLQNTFVVGNDIYCLWNENDNGYWTSIISHYNGNSWNAIYRDSEAWELRLLNIMGCCITPKWRLRVG